MPIRRCTMSGGVRRGLAPAVSPGVEGVVRGGSPTAPAAARRAGPGGRAPAGCIRVGAGRRHELQGWVAAAAGGAGGRGPRCVEGGPGSAGGRPVARARAAAGEVQGLARRGRGGVVRCDRHGELQVFWDMVGRSGRGGREELLRVECVIAKARHSPTRGGQDSGIRHRHWRPWANVIHNRIVLCGTDVRLDPPRGGQSVGLFTMSSFFGKKFSRTGCGHVRKECPCAVCGCFEMEQCVKEIYPRKGLGGSSAWEEEDRASLESGSWGRPWNKCLRIEVDFWELKFAVVQRT